MKICSIDGLLRELEVTMLDLWNSPRIVYPVMVAPIDGYHTTVQSHYVDTRRMTIATSDFYYHEIIYLLSTQPYYKTLDNQLEISDLRFFQDELMINGSHHEDIRAVQVGGDFIVLDLSYLKLFRSGDRGAAAYVSSNPMLRFSFKPGDKSNNTLVEWEFGSGGYLPPHRPRYNVNTTTESRGSNATTGRVESVGITINGQPATLRPRTGYTDLSQVGLANWDSRFLSIPNISDEND